MSTNEQRELREGSGDVANISPETRLAISLFSWAIKYIGDKSKYLVTDESAQGNIRSEMQYFLADLDNVQSPDDIGKLTEEFTRKLEEIAASETIYRIIYEAHEVFRQTRTLLSTLLSEQSDTGYLANYRKYLDWQDERKQEQPVDGSGSRVQKVFRILSTSARNIDIGNAWRLVKNGGVAALIIQSREQILKITGTENNEAAGESFTFSTGLVFAAYTIFVALLLAAEEGKTTRGTTALESLSGSLVGYAEIAPETSAIIQTILSQLKEGIEQTGDLNIDDLLYLTSDTTRSDAEPVEQRDELGNIKTSLFALREACRPSISPTSKHIINGGGYLITLVSALADESKVLPVLSVAVTTALQQVVYDLDKPWGKDGTMTLSTESLDTAMRHVASVRSKFEMTRGIDSEMQEIACTNRSIANSFYKCFRDIFDVYYGKLEEAKTIRNAHIAAQTIAAATTIKQGMTEPKPLKADGHVALTAQADTLQAEVLTKLEAHEPAFFIGDEVAEVGTFDMTKQIAFRHDDNYLLQLSLLEEVSQQIQSAPDMDNEQRAAAHVIVHSWIERVNARKEIARKDCAYAPTTKPVSNEIEHAIEAVYGEIVDNITKKNDSVYVLRRQPGSRRIEIETANRRTDWQGENLETRLTPIHRGVIARLEAEARVDEERADTYRNVIGDINRVRNEQGLDTIAAESAEA